MLKFELKEVSLTLSTRLASLIASLGMRKIDFAAKTGFTQAYISMILSGKKTSPSQRFFDTVGRVFQVNAEWLRDGAGDMFAVPGSDMPASDASMLAKYRLLPLSEQKIIEEIVDAMLLKNMSKQD